jgi:excinuclease UvrABC nuclease subunit
MKNQVDLFPEFEEISLFGPPEYSGVYGVFEMEEKTNIIIIHYIGSSHNIRKRLSNNTHPYRKLFEIKNCVFTRSFKCDDYVTKEVEMIKKYRPILNKDHNQNE